MNFGLAQGGIKALRNGGSCRSGSRCGRGGSCGSGGGGVDLADDAEAVAEAGLLDGEVAVEQLDLAGERDFVVLVFEGGAEEVAERLQQTRSPSLATIEQLDP